MNAQRAALSALQATLRALAESGSGFRLRLAAILALCPLHLLANVYERGVDHILEVSRVVLFDHFNAGAAVFRDLVDVGAFEQAEADIRVP